MRLAALLILLSLASGLAAQVDSSLTDEFGKLSAKERARIAKKEQEESVNDTVFQDVMTQAEGLFQEQRYDEALERFKEARRLRPLNVYPKVKIQDLQALIAKREEAARKAKPEEAVPPELMPPMEGPRTMVEAIEQTKSAPMTIEKAEVIEQVGIAEPEPSQTLKTPVREPASRANPPTIREPRSEQVSPKPDPVDGMHERSFLEGRAVVLERRVVKEGKETIYRKVTHPWGQVVHFRDEQAISDREWKETFGGE